MKLYIPLLKAHGMKINGVPRFIGKDTKFDDLSKIELGHRVIISNNVYFLTHDYSVTTAITAGGHCPDRDISSVRGIKIGNNVFIGMGCLILPGTEINDNVIVGAGSVVRGNIPSNSVIAGNPAEIVSTIEKFANKWSSPETAEFLRTDPK